MGTARALIVAASMFAASSADAAQWYLLRGDTAECEVSRYSPQKLVDAARNADRVPTTRIVRNRDGTIKGVMVTDPEKNVFLFFPQRDVCEKVRQLAIEGGDLPANRNELR